MKFVSIARGCSQICVDYLKRELQPVSWNQCRKTTYELLKRQPEEVFAHFIKHPEYPDPYTFEKWINIYSGHIPGHIEQIQNTVKLWKKSVG